jgi:ribosome-associated protein
MNDHMPIGPRTAIPLAAVEIRASRSSGPGGQHANVTASRVEASIDLTTAAGLTDDERRRLIARLGERVTAVAQDTRSQTRNRALALERLQSRLREALYVAPRRRKTRPSRAAVQERLDAKRHRGARKRGRRPPSAED